MKVAAVQMEARLADVDYNLERAEALLEQAHRQAGPAIEPEAIAGEA